VPTVETFEEALRKSPKDFLRALLDNLRGSLAALDALSARLTAAYGNDAPPTSRIKGTLTDVYDIVQVRTRDMFPPEPAEGQSNGSGAAADGAHASNGAASGSGAVTNREEALRALSKISEFFKATEPHSTIAFTLDDVVRRARLTLPELLAELLPDATARRTFLTSAGIRPPEGDG
jgi:type VI secretion system protein ImpA